jgi:hypothetical protein
MLVAFKGSIINTMLSFHYHNIKNGDRLVCCAKKSNAWKIKRLDRWLSHFSRRLASRIMDLDHNVEQALARLQDQAFVRWENAKEFTILMQDLVKQEKDAHCDEQPVERTIVPRSASICESPLPTHWRGLCNEV